MKKETVAAMTDDGMELARGNENCILRYCPLHAGTSSAPIRGHAMKVDWTCVNGNEDSSVLFVDAKGKGGFSPSGGRDSAWRIVEAGSVRPYAPETDIVLDPFHVASALAGAGKPGSLAAAAEILPLAERFINERFDPDYLDLTIGRRPTLSEYPFLADNPERAVGITAFPFLLPYLVAGLSKSDTSPLRDLVDSIDAGSWSLLEDVSEFFGVDIESVRSMHGLPAWLPTSFWYAVSAAETDPATSARVLSLLKPGERLDSFKEWAAFTDTIVWVELTMWGSGDFPERRAEPKVVAAIWKMRKNANPIVLPSQYDIFWKRDFSQATDEAFPRYGHGYLGTLQGAPKILSAGAWSLLAMLCMTDPVDLKYLYSTDRESVRDVFEYACEAFGLLPILTTGAKK